MQFFFVRSKIYAFLETLGCYKITEHTVKLFSEICGFIRPQYDDVRFYGQSKIKISKMWNIIYQSKDKSVLIIFYWSLSTTLVLELGGLEWKCQKYNKNKCPTIDWLYVNDFLLLKNALFIGNKAKGQISKRVF